MPALDRGTRRRHSKAPPAIADGEITAIFALGHI
jgi:hypothetical protein